MASIQKRQQLRKDGSKGSVSYRVKYLSPDGAPKSRSFKKFEAARTFSNTIEADKARGDWIDPSSAKVTFKAYAEQWRLIQSHSVNTAGHVEARLRLHAYPAIGDQSMNKIKRSDIQAVATKMVAAGFAPKTVQDTAMWVGTVFKSAVLDGVIAKSPAVGIKLPRLDDSERYIPTTEEVEAMRDHLPAQYAAVVDYAMGSGLRWAEIFGSCAPTLNFLRRRAEIRKQLIAPSGKPQCLGPLKTPSSKRDVPLAQRTLDAVAAHLAEFPITHPWGLIFTKADGTPMRTSSWSDIWLAAAKRAGLTIETEDKTEAKFTLHNVRHYYASLLIEARLPVTTVQKRLGHKTPQETFNTYIHLWPDSDDDTREAVENLLGKTKAVANS